MASQEGETQEYSPADEPIWCKTCLMLLNGPTEFVEHEGSKKHKKHVRHERKKEQAKALARSALCLAFEETQEYSPEGDPTTQLEPAQKPEKMEPEEDSSDFDSLDEFMTQPEQEAEKQEPEMMEPAKKEPAKKEPDKKELDLLDLLAESWGHDYVPKSEGAQKEQGPLDQTAKNTQKDEKTAPAKRRKWRKLVPHSSCSCAELASEDGTFPWEEEEGWIFTDQTGEKVLEF